MSFTRAIFPSLCPILICMFLSCGYRKPNPKGLSDIAEHFGVSPAEMVFIGDEQKDIIVAKRFGCMSVLIDRKSRNADFGQEHTIINLTQLEEIL